MKFKLEVTLEKSAPTTGPSCGTLKGNYAHTKRKESSCLDCTEARRVYQKAYRKDKPDKVKESRLKWLNEHPEYLADYYAATRYGMRKNAS